MNARCDEIIIQVVIRTYDSDSRATGERISEPTKVFRGRCSDVWGMVDKAVEDLQNRNHPTPSTQDLCQ